MLPRHVVSMIAGDGYLPEHPAAAGARSETEYRGLKVRVLSAKQARSYRPAASEVAISIRGPQEPTVVLSSRFVAVLELVFSDTGNYACYTATGGDNPDTISASEADAVVAFVLKHPDARLLMVHCTAGVSRSRSLAAAVCASLNLPYAFTVVNDDVHHATTHAFARAARAEIIHDTRRAL